MAFSLRRAAARLFPVQPGEGGRVGIAAAANFLVMGGVIFGRNARDSLFLKNFGIQNLPYMYAASGVLVIACAVIYTGLVDRLERRRFFMMAFLLFGGLLAISRVVLTANIRWFYPALYMIVQAVWILSVMMFWTFAGDIFDTRQAKRLFPVVAMGGLISMIACGFITKPLVKLLGSSANLFVVWVGMLVGALVLVGLALQRFHQAPSGAATPKAAAPENLVATLKDGFRHLGATPLLRAMAGITLTLWVVFTLVDYQFNSVMNQTYKDPNELTAFLGTFRGLAGFGALFVQVALTPWLISTFGVGSTIVLHPFFLLLGTGGLLFSFGYGTAFFAKYIDHVLIYTVQESSFQLLYNPVPLDRRGRVRAFLEGYFKPLMMGVAGLILVVGSRFPKPWQITIFAFVAASIWFVSSLKVRRAYVEALVANLGGTSTAQHISAAEALAKLKDPDSLKQLAAAIRTAEPASAVLAIQFLERFGQPESHQLLLDLLDHPNPQIRATTVAALGRLRHPAVVPHLNRLLQDPDARVRANATEACVVAEREVVRQPLKRCLQDPADRVRANAMAVLAQLREVSPSELLPRLEEMCRAPQQERRTAAAYALGWFPGSMAQPLLLRLLEDPAIGPRLRALRSLGEAGEASCVPALLEAMSGITTTRREGRRALLAIASRQPEETFAQVVAAVGSERSAVRTSAVYVLGRLNRPEGLPHLMQVLGEPDPVRREGALNAVEKLAASHRLGPEVLAALGNCASMEMGIMEENLLRAQAVRAGNGAGTAPGPVYDARVGPGDAAVAAGWLADALAAENLHIRERIFRAASLLHDSARVHEVAQGVVDRDSRKRANALEALEYVIPGGVGRRLARLLEMEAQSVKHPQRPLGEVLLQLIEDRNPAVRACTVLLAGAARVRQCAAAVESRLLDPAPMVREVAVEATWRLAGRESLRGLKRMEHDADPRVRRAAERCFREAALERTSVVSEEEASSATRTPEVPMLLTVEKVLFLKSVPLFASLEGEELASVAEITEEQEVDAGTVVFHAGDSGDELYVIVSGRVKVYGGRDENEVLLAELGERECFGEMALLDAEPRSASVAALRPCRLLKIRAEDFRDLLYERPQISLEILKILARRLRRMDVELESRPVFQTAQQYM